MTKKSQRPSTGRPDITNGGTNTSSSFYSFFAFIFGG